MGAGRRGSDDYNFSDEDPTRLARAGPHPACRRAGFFHVASVKHLNGEFIVERLAG
jgi:hypothetical protein